MEMEAQILPFPLTHVRTIVLYNARESRSNL